MTKLIILNGPPGCGKDSLANHYGRISLGLVKHIKFAESLKVMTHRLYNVPNPEDYMQFESIKDEPDYEYFYGLTPRQAYIALSETYIKPTHGKEFFGVQLVQKMAQCKKKAPIQAFSSSDGGLEEELIPVLAYCGASNILVVKIERPGYTFKNDSRSYYSDEFLSKLGVKSTSLTNKDLKGFLSTGTEILRDFIL
jgi:hypothetical protein